MTEPRYASRRFVAWNWLTMLTIICATNVYLHMENAALKKRINVWDTRAMDAFTDQDKRIAEASSTINELARGLEGKLIVTFPPEAENAKRFELMIIGERKAESGNQCKPKTAEE